MVNMKQKLYFLSLFFFTFSFLYSQNIQVPIQYNTSGYLENNSQSNNQKKTIIIDPLTPTVNGEMNVSESGALTYALPIEILKGLNNFQPDVALVYNSQNGNGQAGWGWNITGISSISRGGKSKVVDGITIGPQFDNADPYYLDGNRLLQVNSTTFKTEKFSKIKITKPSSGEFKFIVQYTDGKIAKYKELVQGQCYISALIDSFNNEIHYSYTVENNSPRINKISYGGSDPSNDKFYIDFIYKDRNKTITIYRNGVSYSNSKILSDIISGSSYTSTYRKYSFIHDLIEDNTVERLRTVTVTNKAGESLKPLNFNYNVSSQGMAHFGNSVTDWLNAKGLPDGTTGLGSVAIGNFGRPEGQFDDVYPVFQIKKGSTYSLLSNDIENDAGTKLFSGKVLTADHKITVRDQVIIVNEKYIGTGNLDNPNSPENQSIKDEVVFEVWDNVLKTGRKVKVQLKGGLTEIQNYIAADPYDDPYGGGTYETAYVRDMIRREFISGDFNNDGLVDFLIVEPSDATRGNKLYFVELGRQFETGAAVIPAHILDESLYLHNKDILSIEFNGDGIPELLVIDKNSSKFSVYKIEFLSETLVPILQDQSLSNFGNDTPLFLGDFNGDGLTDFITPQKIYEIPEDDNSGVKMGGVYYQMETEQLLWWKYTGNGQTFIKTQEDYTDQKIAYLKPRQNNYIKRTTFWQKFWDGAPDEYEYTRYVTHNIVVADFDNDGRSDIITLDKIGKAKYRSDGILYNIPIDNISTTLFRMNPSQVIQLTPFNSLIANRANFYKNKSLQGGTFQQIASVSTEGVKMSPLSLLIPKIDFDKLNESTSSIYIFDALYNSVGSASIDNNNFLEKQIQEVNNGSDVLQKVEYRNMIDKLGTYNYASSQGGRTDEASYLYKQKNEFKYPIYIHKSNSNLYLVHKIHTLFDNKILSKEYRYENAIQHFEGKGFMGFQKTYVSDPYESVIKNGRYAHHNPMKALFWNVLTRNPEMDNAVIKSTYGGLTKFLTESSITNKYFDRGNQQYLILSTNEVTKDNLKKTTVNKNYIYDESDDLKLKTVYTDYSGVGSSISKYAYKPEFSNSDHYFYGKIASVEGTTFKDGLSFTTKDETNYYPDGSIYEVLKYSNDPNASPIKTSFTYDGIGNIQSETLSTTGINSQTTSYEYDDTKRYVAKVTTPDGLFKTAIVNVLGQTLSEVSDLGLTTSYVYDSWGNLTETTDYLGKKNTISKSVADPSTGGVYNLHKKREGGVETISTFDKFDRQIQVKAQSINGKWLVSRTQYDILGRQVKTSEPFFEGETPKWNTVEYDEMNRPIKNITFTGKVINTCYEGMKVTVDDGYKKTSKTLDAMGHVIRQQDHGGVLSFYYYPNGSLKESNYEGIKTTFEIDGWGNKKKMTDPSAGTFTYEYDNLSRITRENTPKGYTLYAYDDLGRLYTEKTYGNSPAENTTVEKTYIYNNQTKLPETITGINNGKVFTYTTYYDQYYRIKGKKEETPEFTYTSLTDFDAFGRADIVTMSTTISGNYTSVSSIKNVYDGNGILVQQNDNDNGNIVWHLSDINAKGQVVQMEYGNGYTITQQYDVANTSLVNITHHNINNGIQALNIDYNYDVNKGVLNWRRNNTFNKKEDFTYDKLNRLLTEAVNGVLNNEYTYDKRGRITSNTELGKYNYNETDYKLQGIDFNTNGQNVNSQRGFATITYNAFKSPLRISLANKENLNFEYNILKTRYSMKSSVTGQEKLYSSDFAIEITKESNGKTQIITYITGDPYSASYIKKEVLNAGALIEKANYYLHRDNLGSILAISKTDGTVVEKRFFDAWGNLKALVNTSGQLITDAQQLASGNLFLDRGYTGHEHLWKVGLINMNARLYDPILRKFLSPDNLVQDPYNTQNYDRFGYVYNNPLLYVDLDGNEITLGVAVVIGVAIALTTKGIMNMINGIPFWYGMGKAAVIGAASSVISFGIGSMATDFFGSALSVGKALFEAGMHAFSSGIMSSVDGGKFGSGALSGAVSSLLASGVEGLGNIKGADGIRFEEQNSELLKVMMVTTGGLGGGISASIAGGNFWQGFRQGIITAGLNHVAHKMTGLGDDDKNKIQKKKVRIQLLKDNIENLKNIDSWLYEPIKGSSFIGKYGTPLDFVEAGGEIYLTNLEYKDGTLTKAAYEFKMTKTVVKSYATIGAGLGLVTGANLGRFGGLIGIGVGAVVGGMVDGAFYLSSEGEIWLNKWGTHIRNKAYNATKAW